MIGRTPAGSMAAVRASKEAEGKIARACADLGREFPPVDEGRLSRLVDALSAEMLETARFDDFVPLLLHRRAREQLLMHAETFASELAS
jgi:hypothetical protein